MNIKRREEILKLKQEGKTSKEISNILNIGLGTVGYYFSILNLQKEKLTEDNIVKIKNLYNERNTLKQISNSLNIDYNLIKNYIKNNKIKKPKINDLDLKKQKSNHVINWKRRKKEELVLYKGGKCEKCGYNKCIEALEFHHLNPLEKDFTISGSNLKIETLKKEVDKCILVCANCHREIHSNIRKIN